MKSPRCSPAILAVALLSSIAASACRSTFVVVPQQAGGYSATDTLYGFHRGDEVRVTFRFDTIMHVDTVTRVDTAWVAGVRTLIHVDTVMRVDTVRVPVTQTLVRVDTVTRVDTIRMRGPATVVRVDTVFSTDTLRVVDRIIRVDTIRVPVTDTLRLVETITRVDTIRVTVTDTVITTVTVRVPGRRHLFVPPGHYPPDGQCRVWIHNLPPGRQAKAAACDALGEIPAGAFVLFGGEAWDFDYDWIAEAAANPDAVPPEIIGLKLRGPAT